MLYLLTKKSWVKNGRWQGRGRSIRGRNWQLQKLLGLTRMSTPTENILGSTWTNRRKTNWGCITKAYYWFEWGSLNVPRFSRFLQSNLITLCKGCKLEMTSKTGRQKHWNNCIPKKKQRPFSQINDRMKNKWQKGVHWKKEKIQDLAINWMLSRTEGEQN